MNAKEKNIETVRFFRVKQRQDLAMVPKYTLFPTRLEIDKKNNAQRHFTSKPTRDNTEQYSFYNSKHKTTNKIDSERNDTKF